MSKARNGPKRTDRPSWAKLEGEKHDAERNAFQGNLIEAAQHFRYCELAGTSLEHRCETCVKWDKFMTAAKERHRNDQDRYPR